MFEIHALGKGFVVVAGSFTATGSTPATVKGVGFTAARSGSGVYTVTFANTYDSFLGAFITYEATSAAARYAQAKSFSSRVLTIDVVDAAGSVADGAGRLNFVAIFKRGTV